MKERVEDLIIVLTDGRKLPCRMNVIQSPKDFDIELQEWAEDNYDLIDHLDPWEKVRALKLSDGTIVDCNAIYPDSDEPVEEIQSYVDACEGLDRLGLNAEYFELIRDDNASYKQYLEESMSRIKPYDYSWDTPEKIIENIHTVKVFAEWGADSLYGISGVTDPEVYIAAHQLWLKLKDAFNAEARYYVEGQRDDDEHICLGSVGPVDDREVLRSAWFNALNGQEYGDYDELTSIIEALHHKEKLETGIIYFGS